MLGLGSPSLAQIGRLSVAVTEAKLATARFEKSAVAHGSSDCFSTQLTRVLHTLA